MDNEREGRSLINKSDLFGLRQLWLWVRDVLKVTEQRWEKLYGQEMKRTTLEEEAIKEAINKHLRK